MSYSLRMQKNHLYSVFFAPRGNVRMADLGMQIAQQYLSPFDRLIGIIGEAGSGKSMLVKGMFPGLELSNDDEGVNVRPLPILNLDDGGFYSAHTYHLDIRFESAFTQMHVLAQAILDANAMGKRVVVEHFELIYPFIKRNAHLLIGVGEEIIITRPNLFGPIPQDLAEIVFKSIHYRKMAHTAEDLCEYFILKKFKGKYVHDDVKHGFVLGFSDKPDIDLENLEQQVREAISEDIPISYLDEAHILIGEDSHRCTGPRMHVRSTGEIGQFTLLKEFPYDAANDRYLMVGLVGDEWDKVNGDLNRIVF
ncbi:alanine-tRNA synthetase second additional domain-containing protein [Hydrogenoanaerobacterium sp.]|uniref:alanine-tRNA synthetase second additional domain-containing protein n=1 Tax=Hydrogenoanaerobacterium sp. TaxID=2953763 RepID=UPI00289C3B4C|nr:alanine-tRNA synthetase second additional domain-containing protein [Hydrogenoanaerobacterium sp.]